MSDGSKPFLSRKEILIAVICSAIVILLSLQTWAGISLTEALGFVSGGVCVWLVVREHLWNWPIGLANNIVFFILFWKSELFADMCLQVIYFALGLYGWIHWLRGGPNRTQLEVSRATPAEWIGVATFIPLATLGLRELLIMANGAAPFWDAITTVISLAAQWLLCRKRIENWFLWITADLIYVPLYFNRQLVLTGILYAVFLLMCIAGWRAWHRQLNTSPTP